MFIENFSLINEFPAMSEQIRELRATDRHFARLLAEYDLAEHVIERIEMGKEAASDERLENLKKERLHLKDDLMAMLRKAAA